MRNKKLEYVRREHLDAWMTVDNTLAVFPYTSCANGTIKFGEYLVKGYRKHT